LRVCVVGLGAVGGLMGLFIARGGGEPVVAFVRRSSQAELVAEGGFHVRGLIEGYYRVKPYTELSPGLCDYLVVSTKAYDAMGVVERLRGYGGVTVIVSNGFGALEKALTLGLRVAGGVVDYGVVRLSDNVVEVRGLGSITIGPPRGYSVDVEPLARVLEGGGASVRVVDDIEPWRWLKATVNAVINPVTTLTRMPNGVVLGEALRPLVEGVVREVESVALRLNVGMPVDPVSYVLEVARRTKSNKSSMLVDVELCRRTEVEEINGYVARIAEDLGLKTPYTRALYHLVKAIESSCLERGGLLGEGYS
jgi:2-dehydropantoate 2-reductase